MKSKPKFSIVIPLRQVNQFFLDALPYYQNQTYRNFEIIVVSEADEKLRFSQTKFLKVGRINPAEKRNQGVANSSGDIIAFIDDDAYPAPDWLENASREFDDQNLVAVGGPGVAPKNASFFQRVSSKVYELSSKKTGLRYGKRKREYVDDWPTCNLLVRKKAFLKVGGFDSRYWGGEDTKLCYSLLSLGKIIYSPDVLAYHHPRKTLNDHLKQTYFWGMWRGFFARIHKESRHSVFFIPSLLILGIILGSILSLFSSFFQMAYILIGVLFIFHLLILGIRARNYKLALPVIFVTFLTYIAYGLGFFKGIIFGEPTKITFNPAEKNKIMR